MPAYIFFAFFIVENREQRNHLQFLFISDHQSSVPYSISKGFDEQWCHEGVGFGGWGESRRIAAYLASSYLFYGLTGESLSSNYHLLTLNRSLSEE